MCDSRVSRNTESANLAAPAETATMDETVVQNRIRPIPRWKTLCSLGAAAVFLGWSCVTTEREQPSSVPQQEVDAGDFKITLPTFLEKIEARHQGAFNTILFGDRDGCGRYFQRYLCVAWSSNEIAATQILPSDAYEITSESRAEPISLDGEHWGKLSEFEVSIKKPCGHVEALRLSTVRFALATTGQQIAVGGFIEPFLTRDVVIAVARSITRSLP
jgi:hypothetical protein